MLREWRWLYLVFGLTAPVAVLLLELVARAGHKPMLSFSRPSLTSEIWEEEGNALVEGPPLRAPISDDHTTSVMLDDGALLIVHRDQAQVLLKEFIATGPLEAKGGVGDLLRVPGGAVLTHRDGELYRYSRTANSWQKSRLPGIGEHWPALTCAGVLRDRLIAIVTLEAPEHSRLQVHDLRTFALLKSIRLPLTTSRCKLDDAMLWAADDDLAEDVYHPVAKVYRIEFAADSVSLSLLPAVGGELRVPTHGLELVNGRYWLFDGSMVQDYDPVTGALKSYAHAEEPAGETAALVRDQLWLVGGSRPSDDSKYGESNRHPLHSLRRWDPTSGAVRRLDSLRQARERPFVTRLDRGRLLVAGGLEAARVRDWSATCLYWGPRCVELLLLLAFARLCAKIRPRISTLVIAGGSAVIVSIGLLGLWLVAVKSSWHG